ncbi:hypothetical protein TWF694_004400 [Orbilia ellipsospora]|uniref:Uncharacterized protein n=1 Tax=Orbilia ellipsospora TaxID=2528407 RepID=A0AAV9WWK6_9PEZI
MRFSPPSAEGFGDAANTPILASRPLPAIDFHNPLHGKEIEITTKITDEKTRVSVNVPNRDLQLSADVTKKLQELWQTDTPSRGYRVYTPASTARGLHTPSLYKSSIVESIKTVDKADELLPAPWIVGQKTDILVEPSSSISTPHPCVVNQPRSTKPHPKNWSRSPQRLGLTKQKPVLPSVDLTTPPDSVKATSQTLSIQEKAPTNFVLLCQAATIKRTHSYTWELKRFLMDSSRIPASVNLEELSRGLGCCVGALIEDIAEGNDDHVFVYLPDREPHSPIPSKCSHCGDFVAVSNPEPGRNRMCDMFLKILRMFGEGVEFCVHTTPGVGTHPETGPRDLEMLSVQGCQNQIVTSDLIMIPTTLSTIKEAHSSTASTTIEHLDLESLSEFNYEEFMIWIDVKQFQDNIEVVL